MRNLSKKAKTIIAGAAIAGLASTGVAYAFWTTTGSGTGSATTTSQSSSFTVAAATVSGTLYPSGPVRASAPFAVTNNGASTVALHSVTADLGATSWHGDCTAADYTITGWAAPVIPGYVTLASGGGSTNVTVSVQMKDLDRNQDDCQGQALVLSTHAS